MPKIPQRISDREEFMDVDAMIIFVHRLMPGTGTAGRTPAWKIPGSEEPGGLQSMGSQRVGHD